MCYLLHPERAEDVHVVAGPTNKPERVGVVVKKEMQPKGPVLLWIPSQSHQDFKQALSFPSGSSVTRTSVPSGLLGLSEVAVLAAVWGLLTKVLTAWGLYL